MKPSSATGVGRLCSLDVDRLPDIDLAELAALLSLCEHHQVWPHQVLITIGTLLPKKISGDRVIGLLSHFGRMWSQAREGYVKTWTG
eukprot:1707904-Pyramimonas_sp.AAC.1